MFLTPCFLLESCFHRFIETLCLHSAVFSCVCHQIRPSDSQYRDYKWSGDSFWSKVDPVKLDTGKLEHLFETKSKEIPVTKVFITTVIT